jgi:hypothetical protein
MRRKIKCPCNREVTTNTFKNHIKSSNCDLSQETKDKLVFVLDTKTQNTYGWEKSLGAEAVGNTDWFISVIEGKTTLDDWSFSPVRKLGQVRPSTANKMSQDRKGTSNPANKSMQFLFTKEEIFEFGRQVFEEVCTNEELDFSFVVNQINLKFPNYSYLISDEYHLAKQEYGGKYATIIGLCTHLPPSDVKTLLTKRRGKKISIGQRSSEKCIAKASEMASKLCSTWRVSIPHKKLYGMVLEYDNEAKIEYRIKSPAKTFSFDIYSPRIAGLIEMHGRVWHDINVTPETLKPMVLKNLANDEVKKSLAKAVGMSYIVFWDDQQHQWADALRELYAVNG